MRQEKRIFSALSLLCAQIFLTLFFSRYALAQGSQIVEFFDYNQAANDAGILCFDSGKLTIYAAEPLYKALFSQVSADIGFAAKRSICAGYLQKANGQIVSGILRKPGIASLDAKESIQRDLRLKLLMKVQEVQNRLNELELKRDELTTGLRKSAGYEQVDLVLLKVSELRKQIDSLSAIKTQAEKYITNPEQ